MPREIVLGVIAASVFPFLLFLLGFDFSANIPVITDTGSSNLVIHEYQHLKGAFTHTILEWTSLCIAAFITILALYNFRVSGDAVIAIIGITYFMVGCLDAFNALSADYLLDHVDDINFIPFTWFLSRSFNALLLIAGLGYLYWSDYSHKPKPGVESVIGIGLFLGMLAYLIVYASVTSSALPQTTYPDEIVKRPFDLFPLILFMLAGVFLFKKFRLKHPSVFISAIILSTIPYTITQLHMIFGSTALFDNHFNMAHATKIVAYSVPLIGLLIDSFNKQQKLEKEISEHKQTEIALLVSENTQRAVVENTVDGIITIDKNGIIESFNQAATSIFGYDKEEVIGKNIKILMPNPYSAEHDTYLARYLGGGEPRIIGTGREVVGKRKDRSIFPMDLAVKNFEAEGEIKFTGLIRDITERKKTEVELKELSAAAVAANKAKSAFLARMNHELRTPLNAIIGFSQLLESDKVEPLTERQKDNIGEVRKAGDHLLSLINEVLDLARVESGQVELSLETIELASMIEECDTLLMPLQREKGINFQLLKKNAEQMESCKVTADAMRLKQVLLNLMSNALKYNQEEGRVMISCSRLDDNFVLLSIEDTGPGIPSEHQKYIFSAYNRLDADKKGIEGTGLGLVISRNLIELMGGTIGLTSKVDHGSTFWIKLPAASDT